MLKQIDDIQSISTEKVIGTQICSQDGHYNVMFAYEIEAGYSYFTGVICRVNHNTAKEAQDYANKIMNTSLDYNDYMKNEQIKKCDNCDFKNIQNNKINHCDKFEPKNCSNCRYADRSGSSNIYVCTNVKSKNYNCAMNKFKFCNNWEAKNGQDNN